MDDGGGSEEDLTLTEKIYIQIMVDWRYQGKMLLPQEVGPLQCPPLTGLGEAR